MAEHDSGRPDRKRRRAIRAHAALAGVAYSVAARQLAAAGLRPGEFLASHGRTVYPVAVPDRWSIVVREQRTAAVKLHDTRRAARLPAGRAGHLVDRFPPGAGPTGPCYAGDGCDDLLAMLYIVAAHEAPGLVPGPVDLSWTAELGEETAVDTVCAEFDRAARRVLDGAATDRWRRVESALTATQAHHDPAMRYAADRLTLTCRMFTVPTVTPAGELYVRRAPWTGARQVLDALLVVAEDGHAPGTRIRLSDAPFRPSGHGQPRSTHLRSSPSPGMPGTLLGVCWDAQGPPAAYEVRLDDETATRTVCPGDLIVLPDQETDAAALQI